jgi:hypothetical protein
VKNRPDCEAYGERGIAAGKSWQSTRRAGLAQIFFGMARGASPFVRTVQAVWRFQPEVWSTSRASKNCTAYEKPTRWKYSRSLVFSRLAMATTMQ